MTQPAKPKIAKPYDRHRRVSLEVNTEGVTEEHHAEHLSVAAILSRHGMEKIVQTATDALQYFDNSAITNDYQEALNLIGASDRLFQSLPSEVRAKFNHDPSKLMQLLSSPNSAQTLASMGIKYEGNRHLFESSMRDPEKPASTNDGTGDSSPLDRTVPTDTQKD